MPHTDVTVSRLRVEEGEKGPNGELFCWWQVTVKGGRETRDLDAVTLARVRAYIPTYLYLFFDPFEDQILFLLNCL